ncbi:hypothetical protein GCM10007380_32440 [Gottfriedia solisilvae]|uniref:Uncharacterized protein n=1 Tax=Gottfriedia solisilvae TaxID=1516104 RepID=A0A8J3AKY4_9BACI|nr:hypothetical protein GCM10007380_32440 [Gottfriedia solisilvae]
MIGKLFKIIYVYYFFTYRNLFGYKIVTCNPFEQIKEKTKLMVFSFFISYLVIDNIFPYKI